MREAWTLGSDGSWTDGDGNENSAVRDVSALLRSAVTIHRALRIPAVWSCTLAIVTRLIQCKFEVVDRQTGEIVEPPEWWDEPTPDLPLRVLIAQLAVGALIDGTSVMLTPRDEEGYVSGLWVADSPSVSWATMRAARGAPPEVVVRTGGRLLRPDQRRLVRHPLSLPGAAIGASPLLYGLHHPSKLSAGSIGQRLVYYLRGFQSPGVMAAVGGEWDEDSKERFLHDWDERYAGFENAHRPLLLDDVKWIPLSMSMKEMQSLEAEQHNDSQIAAAFGMDSSWINANTPGQSLTYANLADRTSSLLQGSLNALLASFEDAFAGHGSRGSGPGAAPQRGIVPPDYAMRIRTAELTRSDEATLFLMVQRIAQAEAQANQVIMTTDEKRARLGLPPLPEGAGGSVTRDG